MSWNLTKFVAAGSLGVFYVVLSLASAGLAAVSGSPIGAGIINVFVGGAMYPLVCLIVRQFGAATIMGLVFGLLVLPLPVLGPSGFFLKLPLALILGLVADLVFYLLRRREILASVIAGGIVECIVGIVLGLVIIALKLPGSEGLSKFITSPLTLLLAGIAGGFLPGGVGGYLGYLLYRKIKNTAVVKRIQGGGGK